MLRKIIGILLTAILMFSVFTGCGSSMKGAADMAAPSAAPQPMDNGGNYSFGGDFKSESMAQDGYAEEPASAEADSLAGGGSMGSTVDVSNAILAERKIIRSANLTIEVKDFDSAFNNIESIILGIGFIQETNIDTDRVFLNEEEKLVKGGTIVLRVDKTQFDSVIGKLKGIGDVFNYTTNGQDVTEQYVDVESRLRLLKVEQEKLEAYLIKLDDLDKIFQVESRLTDIRYQIEGLTGNLNKLSSLVDLATITINMNERRPDYRPEPVSYGEKLLNSLKDSLLEVVEFLGDLLVFIVAALPVLIVLGLFILLGVFIVRRIPKKRKNDAPVTKSDNDVNNSGQ